MFKKAHVFRVKPQQELASEMAIAIPLSKIDGVLSGLEAGHRCGILRYPTPNHLRFQPQHPPQITQLWDYVKAED